MLTHLGPQMIRAGRTFIDCRLVKGLRAQTRSPSRGDSPGCMSSLPVASFPAPHPASNSRSVTRFRILPPAVHFTFPVSFTLSR